MHFLTILAFTFALLNFAIAGEEGFLYQGKKYLVYKDGKKVGPNLDEVEVKSKKRTPSNIGQGIDSKEGNRQFRHFVYYAKDGNTTCYIYTGENIHCVVNGN